MDDDFSFSISGIEEACAIMDRVPEDIVRVGMVRALTAASVPILAAVDVRTPVSAKNELWDDEAFRAIPGTGTGDLKKALHADIELFDDGQGGQASINFGNQGYIANWVEYGHRMIGHVSLGKMRKIYDNVPPKPFMRPGAEASAEQAIEDFVEVLGESLAIGTEWADRADSAA